MGRAGWRTVCTTRWYLTSSMGPPPLLSPSCHLSPGGQGRGGGGLLGVGAAAGPHLTDTLALYPPHLRREERGGEGSCVRVDCSLRLVSRRAER